MSTTPTTTAATATYSGAALAVYGGVSLSDWAMIVGILVAILGLCVNWWYQRKRTSDEKSHNDEILAIEKEKLKMLKQ